MSFLVTRPASPVPWMALMSTLCSAAILRTTGVDFRRSRSSTLSGAPFPPVASPTERASAAGEAAATTAGLAGKGTLGAGAPRVGVEGAGASGAAGAPAGVAGLGGTGAAGLGAAGAFAGRVAAALESVSMRATTVCTATVCPSCTRISASTPAFGAGISASTLSVEISKMGSSRCTCSPTFFIQRERVPSAIDSPICGMMTSILAIDLLQSRVASCDSTLILRQPPRCPYNITRLRQHEILQLRRIWERHIVRGDPLDRSVQPLECQIIDSRGDLSRYPTGDGVFMNDQHPVGLFDRCCDRLVVHREQRAKIQDLD